MRHFYKHVLIFSVYKDTATADTNCDNHAAIKGALDEYKIPYKEVVGHYQGGYELSLMVDSSARKFVEEACLKTKQDCYLERTADNMTYLKFPDGTTEYIGMMTEVSEEEARKSQNYTFDPDTGLYWTAK